MIDDESRPTTLFASKTLVEHAARGLGGVGLGVFAIGAFDGHPLLASAALLGALALLRGCPMCWTVGLFETIVQRKRARSCACRVHDGS